MKALSFRAFALVLALGVTMTLHAEKEAPAPQLGDSKVLAQVPFPGCPEGIAVHDGVAYVSGPAAFGVSGNATPSAIFAFDVRTGALLRTIQVQNQPGPFKAISCIAIDDDDNLYVADETQGIVRINLESARRPSTRRRSTPCTPRPSIRLRQS